MNAMHTGQQVSPATLHKVIAASAGIEIDAPEGKVRVHENNHHVYKKVRVGRAQADGQFEVVWESPDLIAPNPFPQF